MKTLSELKELERTFLEDEFYSDSALKFPKYRELVQTLIEVKVQSLQEQDYERRG